jgi:hypothetical protein
MQCVAPVFVGHRDINVLLEQQVNYIELISFGA